MAFWDVVGDVVSAPFNVLGNTVGTALGGAWDITTALPKSIYGELADLLTKDPEAGAQKFNKVASPFTEDELKQFRQTSEASGMTDQQFTDLLNLQRPGSGPLGIFEALYKDKYFSGGQEYTNIVKQVQNFTQKQGTSNTAYGEYLKLKQQRPGRAGTLLTPVQENNQLLGGAASQSGTNLLGV